MKRMNLTRKERRAACALRKREAQVVIRGEQRLFKSLRRTASAVGGPSEADCGYETVSSHQQEEFARGRKAARRPAYL